MEKMKALVFHGKNDIRVDEVARPHAGVGEAVIRITLTTICGTDLHIVRGEYPVSPGLIIGHEPVGVIEEIGPGVTGFEIGDRVLVGAITPCGQCRACLSGQLSQCGHGEGYEAIGAASALASSNKPGSRVFLLATTSSSGDAAISPLIKPTNTPCSPRDRRSIAAAPNLVASRRSKTPGAPAR